ncbi:MAG: hypothetical protein HQL11_01560 [Candidatus Omnitrophica bacterium]|nr:hypothetical protein [Candidatus Omnitrophota bacterium]
MKTKALERIEAKLEGMEAGTIRYEVLDACRKFKVTWIEFGQALASVYRDKYWRDWGFSTFENYCASELGLKQTTALKLVRSYSFLETDEPEALKRVIAPEGDQKGLKVPELESVNLLRLLKKKKDVDEEGYRGIRREVLEEAKEPQEVRREIRLLSDGGPPKDPAVERAGRRLHFLKGLAKALENAKLEAMAARFLPPKLIDELDTLGQAVEKELERSRGIDG